MKIVFEDREIGELQWDPSLSIMNSSSETKQSLKTLIEESLEEATISKYEYKVYELTNILKMFDAWYEEDRIKTERDKTEQKRPFIL